MVEPLIVSPGGVDALALGDNAAFEHDGVLVQHDGIGAGEVGRSLTFVRDPRFVGTGFFSGEAPDGLTTVYGDPIPADVFVYWRDPDDPMAQEVLVGATKSALDGTWLITGLNYNLRYVVRARASGFDDVTVVGVVPTRTDVVSAVGSFAIDPDTDSITGQAWVEGGLPPYIFTRIDAAAPGITADFSGRHVSLSGFDFLPQQRPYAFDVQVQTGNGLNQIVSIPIYAGLGTPRQLAANNAALFRPTFLRLTPALDKDKDVFIKLEWKDPSAFGNEFRIYRDTSPIDPGNLPPAPYAVVPPATGPAPQAMQWLDTSVADGTTYHYAVESHFAGESKITASKSITARFMPAVIGEYFYGGYYVGDITTPDGTYAVIFAGEEAEVSLQWKTTSTTSPGTFSDVDGWANTQLLTADSALLADHPAAAYCRAYGGAGLDDWYLPSRNELLLPWTNRAALDKLKMGENATYVWSSTQDPSLTTTVWVRRFTDNFETSDYKEYIKRVRPARRVKISS